MSLNSIQDSWPFCVSYSTNMAICCSSYAMVSVALRPLLRLLMRSNSAMLNLITSQLWPGTDRLLSALFNTMLPKLYAISMMWTLNARLEFRSMTVGNSVVTSGRIVFDAPFDGSLQVRSLCAFFSGQDSNWLFQRTNSGQGRSYRARSSLESGSQQDVRELLFDYTTRLIDY